MLHSKSTIKQLFLAMCMVFLEHHTYCSGITMSELKNNIQQCVSDIHEWYDQNKLVINKSKRERNLVRSIAIMIQ